MGQLLAGEPHDSHFTGRGQGVYQQRRAIGFLLHLRITEVFFSPRTMREESRCSLLYRGQVHVIYHQKALSLSIRPQIGSIWQTRDGPLASRYNHIPPGGWPSPRAGGTGGRLRSGGAAVGCVEVTPRMRATLRTKGGAEYLLG